MKYNRKISYLQNRLAFALHYIGFTLAFKNIDVLNLDRPFSRLEACSKQFQQEKTIISSAILYIHI